jgi:hypothetical protein
MHDLMIVGGNRNIDDVIEDIMASKLACSYQDDEHSEPIILDTYHKRLFKEGKTPNFSDITSDIEEHNHSVFYEVALLKFEDMNGDASLAENSGQEIFEMQHNYEDDSNSWGRTANVNYFIEHILSKHKLACIIEAQDEVFNRDGIINVKHMKDVKVVVNDCQSLLFPDFVLDSVAGYCDFANYYKKENGVDVLLLGG